MRTSNSTAAFSMPDQLSREEKSKRSKSVAQLAQKMSYAFRKKFLKREVKVLIESNRDKKTNLLTGYTDTYIKVLFNGKDSLANKLANVEITAVSPACTTGRLKGCVDV